MSTAAARRNIHTLSPQEYRAHMRAEFTRPHVFQREFGAGKDRVEYDISPLHAELRLHIDRLLVEKGIVSAPVRLEELHLHVNEEWRAYNFDDGVNRISAQFYENDAAFDAAYLRFVREVLQDRVFKKPFWFQATPTLRLHCPDGANSHHYPRYHNDISYGHPPEEINVWVPLTEPQAPQLHGFRVAPLAESARLLEGFDFDLPAFIRRAVAEPEFNRECGRIAPQVATPFGRALLFDSRCVHSGEPLQAHTRASLDMRIVFLDDFERMAIEYQGTGRRRILFAPGGCYHTLPSDKL